MEKEIYVHTNPHGKIRLSTKGRIHPDGVKYIRADVAEEQLKQVKKLGLFSGSACPDCGEQNSIFRTAATDTYYKEWKECQECLRVFDKMEVVK